MGWPDAGVGKSTNLSKIAFWLLSNKLRVLIAACDTFRSGAVEQLRTHCKKLTKLLQADPAAAPIVGLFDQGYGKDDAGVADQAIRFAKSEHYDVVLVDTAGRMQGNEPLMRALVKVRALHHQQTWPLPLLFPTALAFRPGLTWGSNYS